MFCLCSDFSTSSALRGAVSKTSTSTSQAHLLGCSGGRRCLAAAQHHSCPPMDHANTHPSFPRHPLPKLKSFPPTLLFLSFFPKTRSLKLSCGRTSAFSQGGGHGSISPSPNPQHNPKNGGGRCYLSKAYLNAFNEAK